MTILEEAKERINKLEKELKEFSQLANLEETLLGDFYVNGAVKPPSPEIVCAIIDEFLWDDDYLKYFETMTEYEVIRKIADHLKNYTSDEDFYRMAREEVNHQIVFRLQFDDDTKGKYRSHFSSLVYDFQNSTNSTVRRIANYGIAYLTKLACWTEDYRLSHALAECLKEAQEGKNRYSKKVRVIMRHILIYYDLIWESIGFNEKPTKELI